MTNLLSHLPAGVPPSLHCFDFGRGAVTGVAVLRASAACVREADGRLATLPADKARIDFGPGDRPHGLRIEGAGANLLTASGDFADAAWVKTGVTVTPGTQTAPDGTLAAATVADLSSASADFVRQPVAIPDDSASYVASIFVRKTTNATTFPVLQCVAVGGVVVDARAGLETNTGAVSTSPGADAVFVEDAGDYWRLSLLFHNNASGNTTCNVKLIPAPTVDGGIIVDDALEGAAVVWGAQFESGTAPTSHISTSGSPVMRAADVADAILPPLGARGTLVAEASTAALRAAGRPTTVALTDAVGDGIEIFDDGGTGTPAARVVSGGTELAALNAGSFTAGAPFRSAVAWDQDGVVFAVGSARQFATVTVPAGLDRLRFGRGLDGSDFWFGHLSRVRLWDRRLPDPVLRALTI